MQSSISARRIPLIWRKSARRRMACQDHYCHLVQLIHNGRHHSFNAVKSKRCFSYSSSSSSSSGRSSDNGGASSRSWGNPFVRLWEAYSRALHRYPYPTKAAAAAIIFFSSDTVTQYLTLSWERNDENNKDEIDETSLSTANFFSFHWDPYRAFSGAVFGVVATGYLHVWWNILEAAVEARIPVKRSRLANTVVKVVVDQGLAAPLYVYLYYVITNFVQRVLTETSTAQTEVHEKEDGTDQPTTRQEQKDVITIGTETIEKANHMLWPTMMRHWKLWPIVHLINFGYVPLHHRVLVQNLVLVGWSGYLSHLNHNGAAATNEHMDQLQTPTEEMSVAGAAMDFLQDAIDSNDVVVFSKTYCPYCKEAIRTLRSTLDSSTKKDIKVKVVELDELEGGGALEQDVLALMSGGQRTVPNVFIRGKHLGGNDDTQAAARSGKLAELLLEGSRP